MLECHGSATLVTVSVVDRHRFYADPDPPFHFDADPGQDLHKSFTQFGKSEIFLTFVLNALSTLFYLSC